MSNLADIDPTRSITVDPGYLGGGVMLKRVAPTVDLPAEFTAGFIDWLKVHGWSARLERDLQCIAVNDQNEDLLSTWLSMDEFERLLDDAKELRDLDAIRGLVPGWKAKDADRIFIDGVWKDPPGA
ncbi:hypothetical protein [Dyella ginsengisoli]|uniref:hypothetical protein n=1 Tax=Dyella ginsengisoli TaxID=363848 RepID=UPI0003478940|nr:hypothetical protein [Dyella ginsengisoli]